MSIVYNIKIKQQFGDKYEFEDLNNNVLKYDNNKIVHYEAQDKNSQKIYYEVIPGLIKFAELPEEFKDFTITNISKAGRVRATKDDTTLYFDMIDGKLMLKRYSYKDAERYFNKTADKKKLIIKLDITECNERILDWVIDVYDDKVIRTNWLNEELPTSTDRDELIDKLEELKHIIAGKD